MVNATLFGSVDRNGVVLLRHSLSIGEYFFVSWSRWRHSETKLAILMNWTDFYHFLQVRSKIGLFAVLIIDEYLNTAELRSPGRQKVSAVAQTGSDRQQQPTGDLQAELQLR